MPYRSMSPVTDDDHYSERDSRGRSSMKTRSASRGTRITTSMDKNHDATTPVYVGEGIEGGIAQTVSWRRAALTRVRTPLPRPF